MRLYKRWHRPIWVYCTISFIAMHGYRTNAEYTGSLGYNSVYRKIRTHLDLLSLLHYIQDRMGVTEGDLIKYRCRRNPGKLSNTVPLIVKDQPPLSTFLVDSTMQYSTIEIII